MKELVTWIIRGKKNPTPLKSCLILHNSLFRATCRVRVPGCTLSCCWLSCVSAPGLSTYRHWKREFFFHGINWKIFIFYEASVYHVFLKAACSKLVSASAKLQSSIVS